MKHSTLAAMALCGFTMVAGIPVQAQQQAQPTAPRRSPLGSMTSQFLLAKITVSDLEKSYDFYTRIIGLKPAISLYQQQNKMAPERPKNDPQRRFVEVALNFSGSVGDPFFDIVQQPGEMPTRAAAKSVVIGIKVPDAPAVIRRAKEAGYQVVREAPVVQPGEMSIGFILDPDGYSLEIIQAPNFPPKGP